MPKNTIKFNAEIKTKKDDNDRTFDAVITCDSVDRDADVVLPSGVNIKEYMNNPVIMFAHDYSLPPVGKCLEMNFEDKQITAKGELAKRPPDHEGPWLPDILHSLIKQNVLKTVSMGFLPKETRNATTKDKETFGPEVGQVISKCSLLEYSLVSIPSNSEALILGVSKCAKNGDIDADYAKKIFGIDKIVDIEIKKEGIPEVLPNSKEKVRVVHIYEHPKPKKVRPKKDIKKIVRLVVQKQKGQLFE